MFEDQGLKLQSKILEIRRLLSQLQELDVDTSTYEQFVAQIVTNLEQKITELHVAMESYIDLYSADSFKESTLVKEYSNAVNNLEKLKIILIEKHNTYAEIKNLIIQLESALLQIDKNNISEYVSQANNLLMKLTYSPTVENKEKQKLISQAYQVVYKILKLELTLSPTTNLLTTILNSDISISFIENLILEEINTLDINDNNNKFIFDRIKTLKLKGLTTDYVDKELLISLELIKNPEYLEQTRDNIETICKQIITTSSKTVNNANFYFNYMQDKKRFMREYLSDAAKKALPLIGINSLILIVGITGIITIKKGSFNKIYKTKTITYNVNNDEFKTPTEDYQKMTAVTTNITLYEPWTKNLTHCQDETCEYNKYQRNIYIYDVSSVEYADLKDYAELDLATINFPVSRLVDYALTLETSNNNQETIIEVNQIIQDLNVYKEDTIVTVLGILLDICIATTLIFGMTKISQERITAIKEDLKHYSRVKESMKEIRNQYLNEQQQIATNQQEVSNLLEQLTAIYEPLPQMFKEDETVSSSLKLIKKYPNQLPTPKN